MVELGAVLAPALVLLDAVDALPESPEPVDELDDSPAPFDVVLDSPEELVDAAPDEPDFDPLRLSVL